VGAAAAGAAAGEACGGAAAGAAAGVSWPNAMVVAERRHVKLTERQAEFFILVPLCRDDI